MRAWVEDPGGSHYVLGSALGPHPFPRIVADFQSVIGREARAQVEERTGGEPDVVVACVGGGSNAIGIFRGFVDDEDVELVGVEAGGRGVETGAHAARFSGVAGSSTGRTPPLGDGGGRVRETTSVSAGLDYPAVGPEHAATPGSRALRSGVRRGGARCVPGARRARGIPPRRVEPRRGLGHGARP